MLPPLMRAIVAPLGGPLAVSSPKTLAGFPNPNDAVCFSSAVGVTFSRLGRATKSRSCRHLLEPPAPLPLRVQVPTALPFFPRAATVSLFFHL